MGPPSTVNAREIRRRWASLAYAVFVLVQLVTVWAGDSQVATLILLGITAGRLLLAACMGSGLRWGWFAALAGEAAVLAGFLITQATTGVAIVTQLLVFVPLFHPALARRDSWVHRWG